jgi:hypothetical protein
MQLRNVPSFGLGNHKEQSNNEIQEQLTAQNSATPLADKTKNAAEVMRTAHDDTQAFRNGISHDTSQAEPGSPQGAQEPEKLASISDSKLSKGIDYALTGAALVSPTTRPAVMALQAGKDVAEKTIDKIREFQQSDKVSAASNTIRDAENAKFFSQNNVQGMADEKIEARQAMRRAHEPAPS